MTPKASESKLPQPPHPVEDILQPQESHVVLQDWRASVLNVLLPIIAIAILPALIQTIYQVFLYEDVNFTGPAIYIVFYGFLIFIAFNRRMDSTRRGRFLLVLTYLTGAVAMARGGLAGDGRIYLAVAPILAIALINTTAGLVTAVISLVIYSAFGVLAGTGLITQLLIRTDNPLDYEYWIYSGLTMGTIVIVVVIVVTRFFKFQIQTLETSQKIAQALAEAYRLQENANLQLEHKVSQRTQELSQANRRLEFMATHDYQTGLPNRMLLFDRLDQTIKKCKRNKARFALFFIDLDDFKQVNDTFGHTVGDKVLQVVGEALSESVRGSDTVARLAGDEFAIILHDVQSDSDTDRVAKKLITALSQPIATLEGLSVTASIGISIFPDHGADADALFKEADKAMYSAKAMGNNRFKLAE